MTFMASIFDFFIHIDKYIVLIVNHYGILSYLLLALIIFVETGIVFFPFIPGDSILFVVGLLAARGSLNLGIIMLILMASAILGDTCNYLIGHFFGNKLLSNEKVVKRIGKHIDRTKEFFTKYGGLAIIYARFVPIVRTIAPFLAGVGEMKYKKFLTYNITGGIGWIFSITLLGYFLGNIDFVKSNLTLILLLIVFISILPPIITMLKVRKGKNK